MSTGREGLNEQSRTPTAHTITRKQRNRIYWCYPFIQRVKFGNSESIL